MAEISKQALKVENNTEFPNNNNGAITPSNLRAFNVDMIDSTVNQTQYNTDSGSWNQQIDALEQFTASATGLTTGSLLVTASAAGNVITFRKGDSSTFNVTVATGSIPDISNLNQATASLQQYTASANIRFSNLESTTASLNTSVTNINAFTASAAISITNLNSITASQQTSINNLNAKTGSYATTGSNTFTSANTFTSISASSFVSASEFIGNGSKITGITASISMPILDEGVPQGNAVSLNFTGSAIGATVVGGVAIISVSGLDSGSFNAYTASVDADLAAIHQATASLQSTTASLNTSASLALYTASFNNGTRNLTFTKGDATTFSVNIPDVSGSAGDFVTTASFNAYTASNDQRVSSLQSATASLFTSASLTIVTASVNNDDITFTKGDGTQFTIQVATGSFAVSASYAETASLAINAKDIIVDVKNTTGAQLNKGTVVRIIGATGDNPLIGTASWTDDDNSANTLGFVVADIPNDGFGRVMTQGTLLSVNTDPALGYAAGQIVYLSGSGQYTNVKPPAPYHEVRLGQVLRAQQNNGSIYVLVQNGYELTELHDVDINTGSLANNDLLAYDSASAQWTNKSINGLGLATTGSNTFNGNQIVNGYVSASNGFYSGPNTTALSIGDGSNVRFISGSSYYNVQLVPGVGDIAFSRDGVSNIKVFTLAGAAGNTTTFQNNPVEFQATVGGVTMFTPLAINAGVSSNVDITGSLKASSTFTASLQEGYVWVGNASGVSTTVATSSFGGTTDLTSLNSFTASQYVSNSYFATTGSNNFIGVETINDVVGTGQGEIYLLARSGSLVLGNSTATPTYAALAHISSSQLNGNTNLIFKSNTSTGDTIVSGSNNIFANPSAPTAGFKRYMTGGNISIGGSGVAIPQISGSMGFSPTISNNYFGVSANPITLRGPVSSSAYAINNNVLAGGTVNFGPSATFNFERAVSGLTLQSNLLAGTINAAAYKTPLSASVAITSNVIGGTVALNMDSSSIGFSGNSVQGGLTINNSYFPSTSTAIQLLSSINGGLYIGTHTIYTSGSNTTFTGAPGRTVTNAVMMGTNNVISASLNGDLAQVASTALIGQGLVVVGSNSRTAGPSAADWGSVFVGRWNSDLGTADTTAETVFAVGTGTGASTRKTGFLIDSGSNTFVEGTFNVSGSASFTGSVAGNVVSASITSNTASIDFNLGNYFEVTSSVTPLHLNVTNIKPGTTSTLIVSASASSSITFSPNVAQPSGSAYSGSAGSIDVLSLVAFNTSKVNLVATKALV